MVFVNTQLSLFSIVNLEKGPDRHFRCSMEICSILITENVMLTMIEYPAVPLSTDGKYSCRLTPSRDGWSKSSLSLWRMIELSVLPLVLTCSLMLTFPLTPAPVQFPGRRLMLSTILFRQWDPDYARIYSEKGIVWCLSESGVTW